MTENEQNDVSASISSSKDSINNEPKPNNSNTPNLPQEKS